MKALETARLALREHTGVAVGVWWNVALLVGSAGALPLDHRIILGLNPWIKPIKFELSVIIFLVTIALMLQGLGTEGKWRRSRAWLGWGFGLCMIVENSIIALQSARGVRSHMNYSTVADALLFSVMGLLIALNTALAAWLLGLWLIARTQWKPALVWGVRLGLLMLLAASAEGVRMVAHQAHTVGAADGGPGLPFVNWSTQHGDLRVAHFFALHALQLLPLLGLALGLTRMRDRAQVAALFFAFAVYAGAVWWMFVTAMAGRAIVP